LEKRPGFFVFQEKDSQKLKRIDKKEQNVPENNMNLMKNDALH